MQADRDREEIGLRVSAFVELSAELDRLQERFLVEILGVCRGGGQPEAKAIDRFAVLSHKGFQLCVIQRLVAPF
ncbi:hypothetical protein D3C73_1491220 [compost metagenome]